MTTDIDTRQLNAFVDGELDLKTQLDIEERLRGDAAARLQVEGLRQLRQAMRDAADYHAAPAALRQRMAALLAQQPAAQTAPPARPFVNPRSAAATALQRWLAWRPMLASAGLLAAVLLSLKLVWWRSAQDERVRDEVVASHVRSTLGQHLVDVVSSDHHTVKPWLSSKLGFSPPVNELQRPGAVFLGGRVDYLDGRPVAALAYRQGEHVVNSFLWPTDAKDRRAEFSAERGFQIAHWTRGGMNQWVISDVNRDEFSAIVRALETADTTR